MHNVNPLTIWMHFSYCVHHVVRVRRELTGGIHGMQTSTTTSQRLATFDHLATVEMHCSMCPNLGVFQYQMIMPNFSHLFGDLSGQKGYQSTQIPIQLIYTIQDILHHLATIQMQHMDHRQTFRQTQ